MVRLHVHINVLVQQSIFGAIIQMHLGMYLHNFQTQKIIPFEKIGSTLNKFSSNYPSTCEHPKTDTDWSRVMIAKSNFIFLMHRMLIYVKAVKGYCIAMRENATPDQNIPQQIQFWSELESQHLTELGLALTSLP